MGGGERLGVGGGVGEGDGTRLERTVNCCVQLAWDAGLDTPLKLRSTRAFCRAQELCESRGGRPGLPVPDSPYGLRGRKATLKNRAQELCESRGGRPGLPVLTLSVDVKQHLNSNPPQSSGAV